MNMSRLNVTQRYNQRRPLITLSQSPHLFFFAAFHWEENKTSTLNKTVIPAACNRLILLSEIAQMENMFHTLSFRELKYEILYTEIFSTVGQHVLQTPSKENWRLKWN